MKHQINRAYRKLWLLYYRWEMFFEFCWELDDYAPDDAPLWDRHVMPGRAWDIAGALAR